MPLTVSEALARAQSLPARFQAFGRTLNALLSGIEMVLRGSSVLLAVFLIHQLLFWATKDPERSFNIAALVLDVTEISWDLVGILYNAVADILNAAVVPLWNGFTFYCIEPAVSLGFEVFSLIFLRKSYTGFIKSSDLPYGGFVCDSSSVVSSTWCGRFNAYDARLKGGDSLTKDGSITFGTSTARRLSELSGEVDFDTPSFEAGELVGILDGLATQSIVMGSSLLDVLFAVGYDVLSTSAVFLFDAAYTILKILMDMLKLVVKSGMLQTLLSIGIDFILIMVLEVTVPALMAAIDAVVCVFQMFSWQSWNEQLACGARHLVMPPKFTCDTLLSLLCCSQRRKSASRAPMRPPICGCSSASRKWSTDSAPFWRQRSTRARAANLQAGPQSMSACRISHRSSPRSALEAAPPALRASILSYEPSGLSPQSRYRCSNPKISTHFTAM